MAVKTWTNGAGTGNWGTAANWSPAAIPVHNVDSVEIPATTSGNISLGLDQSAVNLLGCHVHKGFKGNIGAASDPLRISADLFVYEGDGDLYLQAESDTGLAIDRLIINTDNTAHEIPLTISGSAFTLIEIVKGSASYGGVTALVELDISYRDIPSTDAYFRLHSGAAVSGLLVKNAGILEIETSSTVSTFRQSGGLTIVNGVSPFTTYHQTGGVVQFTGVVGAGDILGTALLQGGMLDYSQIASTVALGIVVEYPGFEILANGRGTYTSRRIVGAE